MLKHTPLYERHVRLGAQLVDFGGWEMPLRYRGIIDEHLAVRRAAGLFDISHMGELVVKGPGAEPFLNRVLTNNVAKLAEGQGQYTLMCNPEGGVIDDLYVYRLKGNEYLLVVNAVRVEADTEWLVQQLAEQPDLGGVWAENASEVFGAVALQGPAVAAFADEVVKGKSVAGTEVPRVTALQKNRVGQFMWSGTAIQVARTGYTGEDGFEIIAPAPLIGEIWDCALEVGKSFGLEPAGLGARDTLRTEMCYPLYGHELDESTTPIEAALERFVALDKGDFVGRARLAEQAAHGVGKKLVAFRLGDKGPPPRPGYALFAPGEPEQVGRVTSGTYSPSLGLGIGMGYVTPKHAVPGARLEIEVRGRRLEGVVVQKPIYRKQVDPKKIS